MLTDTVAGEIRKRYSRRKQKQLTVTKRERESERDSERERERERESKREGGRQKGTDRSNSRASWLEVEPSSL